jgi:hypothetical protein
MQLLLDSALSLCANRSLNKSRGSGSLIEHARDGGDDTLLET